MKFFDELEIGEKLRSSSAAALFTAPDIKAFAAKYDPQVFHLDEAAAAAIAFRRALCVRVAHRRDLDAADGGLPSAW